MLVAAGLGPPSEYALISLLALNGLRVSEATGADIEHLGLERAHWHASYFYEVSRALDRIEGRRP